MEPPIEQNQPVVLNFVHDGSSGTVTITCVPNDDPASVGKGEDAQGLPVCSAIVEHPGEGYRAFFGWIQLVRSTDNRFGGRAFEMDPLRFFEDSPAPFCFFGLKPVLFDAPSRDTREPLEWLAHAFLTVVPRREEGRSIVPLVGFAWGFDVDEEGAVRVWPVERLRESHWEEHLPYLRDYYRTWSFLPGVPTHP